MMRFLRDRTWLEVDLGAIGDNYREVRRRIGPDCQVIAVVKADAYGLGAARVARELEALGCPMFSVSCIQEAMELRENGISAPILLMGVLDPIHAELAVENDVEVSIVGLRQAKALSSAAASRGCRLKGHIKLDVGLGRFGIVVRGREDEAFSEILSIAALRYLDLVAVYTHVTASKLPGAEEFNRDQLELFARTAARIRDAGIALKRHCCSTLPMVRYPEYCFDYVRVAAIIYGQTPAAYAPFDIHPAFALKTRIWQIKEVEAGTPISYGPTFHTLRRTRLAIVPVGFADGLRRTISNRGSMLVRANMAPLIGMLSSDFSILDVTDIPEAAEGDVVTVFGSDGGAELPASSYADLYPGTVSEVTSAISSRVPRVYLRKGRAA